MIYKSRHFLPNHSVLACMTKSVMKYFDHSVTQPGLVAQLVERRCSNQEVVGSNPSGVKDFSFILVLISNFFL